MTVLTRTTSTKALLVTFGQRWQGREARGNTVLSRRDFTDIAFKTCWVFFFSSVFTSFHVFLFLLHQTITVGYQLVLILDRGWKQPIISHDCNKYHCCLLKDFCLKLLGLPNPRDPKLSFSYIGQFYPTSSLTHWSITSFSCIPTEKIGSNQAFSILIQVNWFNSNWSIL